MFVQELLYILYQLITVILMYYCLFVLQLSRQDGVHSVDIKVPPKYHLFTNIFFFTFYFLLSCELCQNNQLLMFRIFVFFNPLDWLVNSGFMALQCQKVIHKTTNAFK